MEGSTTTVNKDQEIAGPAATLFSDSSSPYDAFFVSDSFQTSTQQDNQSAASFFDSLSDKQPSQIQQTGTDYSSYYGYSESTYGATANATGVQQYDSITGYDYNNYGGQYNSTNANGITGEINSSVDPANYQYNGNYTGYSYDPSYANGQEDYSQYYNYSQPEQQQQYQQQYYDPNSNNSYYYYHDQQTYYNQINNNSNETNFQNYTQDSINLEQKSSLQEFSDQSNLVQYNEQKDITNDIQNNQQLNNVENVLDKSIYNESNQEELKSDVELSDVQLKTDVDNNKNHEFSKSDNDKENNVISREIEYSIQNESIENHENQDIVKFQEQSISSNNLTSLNDESVAAVALVETIETNQESVISSTEIENEKDNDLNDLVNEDQEVNIIHKDDRDIFEYQPQELESHPNSELSQSEPPISSLIDESKISSEISEDEIIDKSKEEIVDKSKVEIIDKSNEESTKLDDLDDLVLGPTSKSGTSEVTQEKYSISSQDNDSKSPNSSSYQYGYSGQDYQYNEQWVSNDTNYQYQEYDTNKTTDNTTTSTTEQLDYKHKENDSNDSNQITRNITAELDYSNYQYDTSQPAADSTSEKEQSYQYSNNDNNDNVTGANQYSSVYNSNQTTVENSSTLHQNNYHYSGYEANQSTAVDSQYQGYDMGVNVTTEQDQSNYQYQVYENDQSTVNNKDLTDQTNYQYTGYDTNYQVGTEQTNYQYQEYETRQVDTKADTDQSNYQYYQGYQSTPTFNQSSPPPVSPSSKRSSLISCTNPQCGGENKATAKFCSDCGNPINNITNSITPAISVSGVTNNTNLYNNNNLNTYSSQTLPYNHSQDSYSASYGNAYDTQYSEGVSDTYQLGLGQQQYYGPDETNAINDPLGRSKGCRPVVAFGFGGKIYTMFPRTVQRFTSTDQSTPITKSAPGAFTVRVLKDIIPISNIADFPGPLLMDNNKGGVKAKKKSVLKYLNDQIQALENNISTLSEGAEKKNLENILIVWNLFKIMFENEGSLIGNPKVEELVRKILVPSAFKSDNDEANFTVPADTSFDTQKSLSQTLETSLTYSVSTTAVDKLQELLLKGDRVAAIHHAMSENLWAHALIIASCVNKDLWKEVVTGFVKHEMGTQKGGSFESNGRESLRVLYSLFAGQGQSAVKEFLPHGKLLNRIAQPSVATMIPTSHYVPYASNNAPPDSLIKWKETIAMILANRAPGDNQAISALGDMLKEYGWIHAAHICYILSPNVSIISGFDAPNVRFTTLGNDYTHNLSTNNFYNWQSLRMTEIYEFGLSLNSNDGSGGLPHLQAYKLLYARWLADCGYLIEARRYCESIANIVKVYTKGSPYFHGCFLEKLKDLTQRLLEHGGQGAHESSSWLFAKKMPKATLDSLWGSLEGKFNKFVAGDAVDENVDKSSSSATETVGPFSHFSSISHPTSEAPSRSVSASSFRTTPNPTVDTRRSTTPNVKQLNGHHRRSSTPGAGVHGLINGGYNTSSPTTFEGQNGMSSVPEGISLESSPTDNKNGYYGQFGGQTQQYSGSYGYNHYDQQSAHNSSILDHSNAETNSNKQNQQTMYPYYQPDNNTTAYKNDSAWWNNSNADFTNTTEDQEVDQTHDVGEGEFISPMDGNFTPFVPAPAPVTTSETSNRNNNNIVDDYDDLGLGNRAFGSKKNDKTTDSVADTSNDNNETTQTEPKKEEKQEEQKVEKGWFGKWFGGKKEGGKSANLGEESSFYFDPVQKRWINKKAGAETNNTLAPLPPPPQRSKTTSPLPSRPMSSNHRQSLPPIDNKDLTSPPSSATPPPPNKGGRASSASMRRNIRSRYVDVINQPSPNQNNNI